MQVRVTDYSGSYQIFKGILDSAAQLNFISTVAASKLKLPREEAKYEISGIGSVNVFEKVNIQLHTLHTNQPMNLSCVLLSSLPALLNNDALNIDILSAVKSKLGEEPLADPTFFEQSEVHLILGANVFWATLLQDRIPACYNLPTLQNTQFGWVVGGLCADNYQSSNVNSHKKCFATFTKISMINETLQKFWEIEDCSLKNDSGLNECEVLFKSTTERAQDGRFVVELPFKYDPKCSGNSRETALKRLYLMERKLKQMIN